MARTKEAPATPAPLPAHLWTEYDSTPPPARDVLTQAAHFFDRLGYTATFSALLKEASQNGVELDVEGWEKGLEGGRSETLMALWEGWREQEGSYPGLGAAVKEGKVENKVDATPMVVEDDSSDASSTESEDDETEGKKAGLVGAKAESTSDDESSDSSDDEAPAVEADTKAGAKRKRVMTPNSSSEDDSSDASSDASSSDSSDDEVEAPSAKRAKTVDAPMVADDSSSASSSDEDSDVEMEDTAGGVAVDKAADSSSASSSSDSDSSSSSSDSEAEDAASDSSSSSSSDSDSEPSASPPPKQKKAKKSAKPAAKESKPAAKERKSSNSSSSSATLAPGSPKPDKNKTTTTEDVLLVPTSSLAQLESPGDSAGEMHPDRLKRMAPAATKTNGAGAGMKKVPATEENVAKMKKGNVPFSRIPKDTVVDERFKSNEYVSYEYADKAYQDLVVTKGKGFTKEKNKKKRGESPALNTLAPAAFALLPARAPVLSAATAALSVPSAVADAALTAAEVGGPGCAATAAPAPPTSSVVVPSTTAVAAAFPSAIALAQGARFWTSGRIPMSRKANPPENRNLPAARLKGPKPSVPLDSQGEPMSNATLRRRARERRAAKKEARKRTPAKKPKSVCPPGLSKGQQEEWWDWQRECRRDLSLSPLTSDNEDLGGEAFDGNVFGLKEDTFAFISGCQF